MKFDKETIRKALNYDLTEKERIEADNNNLRPFFNGVVFSCWEDDLGEDGYFKIFWEDEQGNKKKKLFKFTDIFESEDTKEDYQVIADFLNNYLNK